MTTVFPGSLCHTCQFVRVIISGKGSQFLLCQRSLTEPQFAKYPAQPVRQCAGYRSSPVK